MRCEGMMEGKGELTAFLIDHAVLGLLGGQGAGRAVVGKLRHVAVAGARARPAGGAARRPGDPLRHGAGGSVWRREREGGRWFVVRNKTCRTKNLAFGVLQRQKFLAYALTGETEMRNHTGSQCICEAKDILKIGI